MTLCTKSAKYEKKQLFLAFCTISCRKCEKTAFFHVFQDTLYKVRKKCEKQRFLRFLHDVRQKVNENSAFSRFSRHSVQSLQNMRKKHRFFSFLHDVLQKVWENSVFFHVFRDNSYKVCKKCEKTAFFELFGRRPSKSVSKQCFFTFFETLCMNSQKMRKNSVFWVFWTSRKKCKKTAFFHVFRDTLYEFAEYVKKQRFLSFLHDVPQKVRENSAFSRFSRHFVQSPQIWEKTFFF